MRLLLVWLLCVTLTYGMALADFQAIWTDATLCRQYGRRDAGVAMLFGLMAPLSTLPAFMLSGFAEHGLLFWPDPTRCAAQAQAEREAR